MMKDGIAKQSKITKRRSASYILGATLFLMALMLLSTRTAVSSENYVITFASGGDGSTFTDGPFRVESFWVQNDTSFTGHNHVYSGFEEHHWQGDDARQGFRITRIDGGSFSLLSVDYQLAGSPFEIGTAFPSLNPGLQVPGYTQFPVVQDDPLWRTVGIAGFVSVSEVFITMWQSGNWDNIVLGPPEAVVNRYTLITSATPPEAGTVSLNPAPDSEGKYAQSTMVTLSAQPEPGYAFVSWGGDATGISDSITITMDANKSVTANFEPVVVRLIVNLPPGIKAFKAPPPPLELPPIDLSIEGQAESTPAGIFKEFDSKRVPVAELYIAFSQLTSAVDFGGLLIADADEFEAKAVIHRDTYPEGVSLQALLVKKQPEHDRVRVCPQARSLAEVTAGCAGGYVLAQGSPDLQIILSPSGREFWRITGISGTGAMGLAATPPPSSTGEQTSLPDPQTWALAVSGLLFMGAYLGVRRWVLRRRDAR